MSDPHPESVPDSNSGPKPLGQYLVEARLLTPAHIEVALYDQRERGYRLGDILAMRGWVKEEIIEWIVQNKLLPEREVLEEDFDTVLINLKEVLEKQEESIATTQQPRQSQESPKSEAQLPPTPIIPAPPKPTVSTFASEFAERETLIIEMDEETGG